MMNKLACACFALIVVTAGGCAAPHEEENTLESASQALTAAELTQRCVGDYMQFIDLVDLTQFNSSASDFFSLTLRADGSYDAVVTPPVASRAGYQAELYGDRQGFKGKILVAPEGGTWSVTPPTNTTNVWAEDYQRPTLTLRPSGQPARIYGLGAVSRSPFSPLEYTELFAATSVSQGRIGQSRSLYRASFFRAAPQYRVCLGQVRPVATADGPQCATAP